MIALTKGSYRVRPVADARDSRAVMALRSRCFGTAGGSRDAYDAAATHVLVEHCTTGAVVAGFRMAQHTGATLPDSYAAQYYDLRAVARFGGPMLELGRFCIDPDHTDPDIARIAWAALTAYVDARAIGLLFGCASFAGTQTAPYLDAFALLKARHLAPEQWRAGVKAPDVFAFATVLRAPPDLARANATMPPLLRSYLMMGGWVSDHAVIDRAMNTLHVFTALDIRAIPPARKRLLRALV